MKLMKLKKLSFFTGFFLVPFLALMFCKGSKTTGSFDLNLVGDFLTGTKNPQLEQDYSSLLSSNEYKEYKKNIEKLWGDLKQKNIDVIKDWSKKNLVSAEGKTVFYPFSGPDALNVMSFNKGAKSYFLIGLEEPGEIATAKMLSDKEFTGSLGGILNSLRTLMSLNFFRTNEMKVDLKKNSMNQISNIILYFIKKQDCRIETGRKVALGPSGEIETFHPDQNSGDYAGVEYTFYCDASGKIQKLDYFKINLEDSSLKKKPYLQEYVKKHGRFDITMLKASSYLMHIPGFYTIRNLILTNSDFIMQADSGIPLRYFDEHNWKLDFYGKYHVLKMFADQYQKNFDLRMQKESHGVLPFYYGYGSQFKSNDSNLMTARLKKQRN